VAAKKPRRPKKDKSREHREEQLDEALKDSFPASDPPAITFPHPPEDEES
jgi:hypothetical protein